MVATATIRAARAGGHTRTPLHLHSTVSSLLAAARRALGEAALTDRPAQRYACAHLAALRSAAAVLAARARPESVVAPHVRRSRNAWVLLAEVAPELAEWAAFFSAGATKRAAAEACLDGAVSPREADDLLRDVESFLALVETTVGLAPAADVQPLLRPSLRAAGAS